MSELLKPIVIGDYFHGGEMGWAWYHHNHSRLAIIGDNELSPKRAIVRELARELQKRDEKVVYWVTGEEDLAPGQEYSVDAIYWIEELPDPPIEYVDRDIFIENRKFFSSAYMQLLCKIRGTNPRLIFPTISYRSHIEGPMHGYLRAINQVQDHEVKEWFVRKFEELQTVSWTQTKEEGRKYYICRNGSIYEKALSLLKALWSFWAYTAKMDSPQQLMLIIEPPKELLLHTDDPIIRNILGEALRIMKYLTEELTLSLVLSSEAMYPILDHHYRYKIIFQTKDSDIDLWDEENQKNIGYPPLYEAWQNGRIEAGLFEDSYTGNLYALFFRTDNMRYMDEFEDEIT